MPIYELTSDRICPIDETSFGAVGIFDQLRAHKEQIESGFGEPLCWERLEDKRAGRVKIEVDGSILNEKEWPELQERMIDNMIRFERTLRPRLDAMDFAK